MQNRVRPRIINVNDDAARRYIVTRMLTHAGFEVGEAETGADALTIVTQHAPDLVVLDVKLPDVDGYEVCRRLRASPATADVPVLLVSAHLTDDADRVQGLDCGANEYLAEPVSPSLLVATCRALLRARQAEQALRTSEREHRLIFEGLPLPALIADPATLQILTANQAACERYGYERCEIAGVSLGDVVANGIEEARLIATPPASPVRSIPARHRTKGGELIDVEVSVGTVSYAGARAVMLVVHDVTERKRAEHAVRTSEHRLRRVMDVAPVGILLADTERVVYANDAFLRIVGYTREDVEAGKLNWREMTPPQCAPLDTDAMDEPRARPECTPFEKEYVRKDGTRVPVLVGAAVLDHWPIRWVCFVFDMTERERGDAEREQARIEAEAANAAKDAFLATLGHELRTPIGTIKAAAQLLGTTRLGEERLAQVRGVIARQSEHLARLIDDLLDAGRLATGKIVLDPRPIDLAQVVSRTVTALETCGETAARRVTVDTQPAWVNADPVRIEQVVTNLVLNAVKFTAEGGAIRVSVRNDGPAAVLTVEDTGIGVDPHLLPRIFDLFVQGEPSGGPRAGLGIGLALVRRLVEVHGGTVDAASAGRDQGTTMTVRLPRIPEPVSSEAPGSIPVTPRRKILVVEDNADAREMLIQLLELGGHEVQGAADGPTGLDLALRLRPDFALVDIGLPGMDGFEVARALRAQPEGRSIYLVALTGHGLAEHRAMALAAGFDAHVVKPVEMEALEAILGRLHQAP